jgi:hypothetical protein
VVPGDGTEVRGEIHMNKGRVGEERRGKEMDGCPLTGCHYLLETETAAMEITATVIIGICT